MICNTFTNPNLSQSKDMLCWYEDFKHDKLPILTEYAKTCNKQELSLVNNLITSTTQLNTELTELCNKEKWQFLPIKQWRVVYDGLHYKITQIKENYESIATKLTEFEQQLGPGME